MSCTSCGQTPCGCAPAGTSADPCNDEVCFVDPCAPANPDPNCRTLCNLDKSNNIWYVPFQPGFDCKCKLDLMTYQQIINVLESVPGAAKQLCQITDDPCLLMLARTVKLKLPQQEDDAICEDRLMRNSLPYYTLFRGNVGGNPGPVPRPRRSS